MNLPPFLLIAGARPNFMKVAPIARVFRMRGIPFKLVHTGQHHDPLLSKVFLRELGLGRPDFNLEVGSGTHAQTTARVMERCEPLFQKINPRAVVVVGDVNSTLAATLAAGKINLPVAHVEAGLRSGDRTMPEEINRVLTDSISDLLLTPSPDADANLKREGVSSSRIARVGNVMIDSLKMALSRLPKKLQPSADPPPFLLMTFHRPSNVDSRAGLLRLISFLEKASQLQEVQLPLHPRTQARLREFGLWEKWASISGLKILQPLGYFDFVEKMRRARAVVTDSGGIQEETTHLGVPCLVMRATTERPICIERGTTELMGEDYPRALRSLKRILKGNRKKPKPIPLWDGRAAERIVSVLVRNF